AGYGIAREDLAPNIGPEPALNGVGALRLLQIGRNHLDPGLDVLALPGVALDQALAAYVGVRLFEPGRHDQGHTWPFAGCLACHRHPSRSKSTRSYAQSSSTPAKPPRVGTVGP